MCCAFYMFHCGRVGNLIPFYVLTCEEIDNKLLETRTVLQILCIALTFFASGTCKKAVRKVYLELNHLMNQFIIFLGHVPVNEIKEGFTHNATCIYST